MDAEILKGFAEEAKNYVCEMRAEIESWRQNPAFVSALINACDLARTIKGAAQMVGLDEAGQTAKLIEEELTSLAAADKIPAPEKFFFLQEQTERLDAMFESAVSTAAETDPGNSEFKVFEDFQNDSKSEEEAEFEAAFSEAEFASESGDFNNQTSDGKPEEIEEFEIDPEMMEIFGMEAEDHLQNIGNNLTLLELNPDNREALLEIRRSAHTLKGSAGIVGLKKLSSLAHRIEDLLDYISENEIKGDKSIFDLLLTGTDCLESLASGDNSPELNRKIGELNLLFDGIADSLKNNTSQTQPENSDENVSDKKAAETVSIPEVKTVEEITTSNRESGEESEPATGNQNRSVIRVSLERLDELASIVNEMVVSRSIFEQRLLEFERQLNELQLSNKRLRRSTEKLEVEFEAGTLGSFSSVSSFQNSLGQNEFFPSLSADEFDALEFDQYTEFHQTTRELLETTGDTSAILNELENLNGNFGMLFETQRRLFEEIQDSLMRLRMVPLGSLSARLHRTIRVTAAEEAKSAELEILNENIEIDTQILDSFSEPLLHLLRNAVAHGIEPPETRRLLGKPEKGTIKLAAYIEGTHIVFTVSDDGRGISAPHLKAKAVSDGFISQSAADAMSDKEAFSLIFLPGLSTAASINQISGRGVGMDIVKSGISRRNGTIAIDSELQKGTTFTIRLPMSLAITRALMVESAEQTFALPGNLIKKIIDISPEELKQAEDTKILQFNGEDHKFFFFNELLGLPGNPKDSNVSVLIPSDSKYPCALAVDFVLKHEEVVIKPLGSLLNKISGLTGATILGDGTAVPVLDLIALLDKASTQTEQKPTVKVRHKTSNTTLDVMIVDDSPSVRQINSNLIKKAGWNPILARDGLEALEFLHSTRKLPDVILTDVEMPGMDGYELLSAINSEEKLRRLPVVMITSRAGEKHRRKAYDLGVSSYLTKPFDESTLTNLIRDLAQNGV